MSGRGKKKDENQIKEEIMGRLLKEFRKYDKFEKGQIKCNDVKRVVLDMKCVMAEVELFQMISDLDKNNTGLVNYEDMMPFIVEKEYLRLKESDETELMDAFVAMGGEEDGSGSVNADILIEIIKN